MLTIKSNALMLILSKSLLTYAVCLLFTSPVYAQQKSYNILSFGAIADGKTNNVKAIQAAIDKAAANGGGMVVIPAGNFVTGVIRLRSNIDLHLTNEAHLLATTNRADYGPQKASALIVAENEHHLGITGTGTIDGQAALLLQDIYHMLNNGTLKDAEWKSYNDWHQMRPAEDNRPHLVEFKNCNNITLKNYTIKNGLCWIQTYRDCSNMVIDSIHVESNTFLNNDGIDLVDCKKVKLSNSSFNVADDGICLKSSNPGSCCEDIDISNCRIRSSASAFKLGTASAGGFKRIKVNNLFVYDTFRSAVAIESVDGGVVEDIDIRNIKAINTGNAIFIRLGKRKPDAAVGKIRRVHIVHVKAEIPLGKSDAGYPMEGPVELFPHNVFPASISGIPGHPVQDVILRDINIMYAGGANKERAWFAADSLNKIPEKVSSYPEFSMFGELPAWAFYIRHAQNILMKQVTFSYKQPDQRIPCIFDDVNKLHLIDVNIKTSITPSSIILNKVKQLFIRQLKTPQLPGKAITYTNM